MFGWFRKQADDLFGRSGSWARVRLEHLGREPACAACGRTKTLEVHHVIPYHRRPDLELDPANLLTLCADPCHLVHGHFMSWKRENAGVREDAARYQESLREAARKERPGLRLDG